MNKLFIVKSSYPCRWDEFNTQMWISRWSPAGHAHPSNAPLDARINRGLFLKDPALCKHEPTMKALSDLVPSMSELMRTPAGAPPAPALDLECYKEDDNGASYRGTRSMTFPNLQDHRTGFGNH